MRFARMIRRGSSRTEVESLSGGLNTEQGAEQIGDAQLSACRNMYLKAGELVTRPGFYTAADQVTRQLVEGDTPKVIALFTTADGGFSLIKTPKNIFVWNREGMLIGNLAHAYDRVCTCGFFADGAADTVLFFGSYNDGTDRVTRIILTDNGADFHENLPVYIPTAFVNARPSPTLFNFATGGVPYEGYNVLTGEFRSLWTSDGEGLYYAFPVRITPPASLTYTDETGTTVTWTINKGDTTSATFLATINGVSKLLRLAYNYTNNCLWLEEQLNNEFAAVALPEAGYADNLSVTATRSDWSAAQAKEVYGMGFSAWFGGTGTGTGGGTRLFVSGNADKPNLVRYSDVNEPTFFPDNNFFYVGSKSEPVTAFGKQNACLVIFKPREIYACEYAWSAVSGEELAAGVVPEVTSDAWFPLRQIHGGIGCDCPKTVQLCGNHLVWANAELGRVFTLTDLAEGEGLQMRDISRTIAPSLKAALQTGASSALWENHYLLLCDRKDPTGPEGVPPRQIFLFDCSRTGFGGYGDGADIPVAWYRWEFDTPLSFYGASFRVNRCILMGREDSLMLMGVYHVPSNDFFCPFSLRGDADMQAAYDGEISVEVRGQVAGGFSTKAYGFGLPFCRKTVEGLLMQVRGEGEGAAFWESDRDGETDPYPISLRPDRPGPLRLPCRLSRVRTVRLTVQVNGRLCVGGLAWSFRRLEEVK